MTQKWYQIRSNRGGPAFFLAGTLLLLALFAGDTLLAAGRASATPQHPPVQAAPPQQVAEEDDRWMETIPYDLDSRAPAPAESGDYRVHVPDAAWMRLSFADYHLAPGSYLLLTSALDGADQRIDAAVLERSGGRSAYFNGDTVRLELHRARADDASFFRIEEVLAGSALAGNTREPQGIETICGSTDNRTLSNAARVGRLTYVSAGGTPFSACTAWLTSNGAVLTAGHCVDFDPDRGGPQLPDGVLDVDNNDLVEFDVPLSDSSGNLQFADPEDQYDPDLTSFTWNFDGEGQGLGKDWAVFRIEPNTTTNQRAHVVRGFYRMTNNNPSTTSSVIRITGYGTDSTPDSTRNQVQQTHSGSYEGENSSGANYWHRYRVDTTGGNSGSPIIWDSHPTANYAVGIHTNGGCSSSGSTSANSGTSFEHGPLEEALRTFPGSAPLYVDQGHPGTSIGDGRIFYPFPTVFGAEAAMAGNDVLSIVRGTYNETGIFNAPMIVDAPVGSVVIGQ